MKADAARRRCLQAAGFSWVGWAWPGLAQPVAAARLTRPADTPAGLTLGALHFPVDFGAHPDTRTEWWYLTGALQTVNGDSSGVADAAAQGSPLHDIAPTHGFQITFFRSRTNVAAEHPSTFAAKQLVFAHAALTDLKAQRLRHDQRIARVGFGVAQAVSGDTALKLRDWTLTRTGPADHSVYRTAVHSETARFALDLNLTATQPVLLQGQAGISRKGPRPEQASRYYSQPQLTVSGQLSAEGRSRPVRGIAWFDHEWSNSLLDPQAVGWDWIGMNLFDGSALTAFHLRRADGSALWNGGSLRGADGVSVHHFAETEVRFAPGRQWTSPATRASYPVEWQIETPAGRHTVRALLDAQELDSRASTGAVYWEGLSELLDAQGRVVGRGYLEMTGYAGRLRLP